MKIIIFGAAGGTGRALTEQALAQGYIVTGFDRNPEALKLQHPNLTMIKGDIFDPAGVEAAIAGQDIVFCVLGVRPGVTAPVCSVGTKNIILGMQKQGVKRFIVAPSRQTGPAANVRIQRNGRYWFARPRSSCGNARSKRAVPMCPFPRRESHLC